MSTIDNTDRNAYMALGTMFGIFFGISAGLLFAPKSGEEMRQNIRDQAADMKEKTRKRIETQEANIKEKLSDTADIVEDQVEKVADKTKRIASSTANRAHEAFDKANGITKPE